MRILKEFLGGWVGLSGRQTTRRYARVRDVKIEVVRIDRVAEKPMVERNGSYFPFPNCPILQSKR